MIILAVRFSIKTLNGRKLYVPLLLVASENMNAYVQLLVY